MSKKRFRLQEAAYLVSARSAGAPLDQPSDFVLDIDRTQVELLAAELIAMTDDLMRGLEPGTPAALRLLALWARLSRVDPAALPAPEPAGGSIAAACRSIRDYASRLAEALNSADPAPHWLERAGRLKESYLHPAATPADRERTATLLLLDLDDMELAAYASAELNHPIDAFNESVHQCRTWLARNVHAFLSSEKTIESELRIMRRDLSSINRPLAQTAHKYLQIRTAIEEMDRDLTF